MQSKNFKSLDTSRLTCYDALFPFSWFVLFLSSYSGIELLHSLDQVFVGTAVVGTVVLHSQVHCPPLTGALSSTHRGCSQPPQHSLWAGALLCSELQCCGRHLATQAALTLQMVAALFLPSDCSDSFLSSSVGV